jgi:MEDS: MEthanogen/methylotroph, DcmR Sensory domain
MHPSAPIAGLYRRELLTTRTMAERSGFPCGTQHVFHEYGTDAEAIRVAGRYIAEGVARQDLCLFFGSPTSAARLLLVDGVPADGGFKTIVPADVFGSQGMDAIAAVLTLRNHWLVRATAAGRRLRFVIDAAAEAPDDEVWSRTEAWESMFIGAKSRSGDSPDVLCLYDSRRYPPDLLELARYAHPHTIGASGALPNPVYEPPRHAMTAGPGLVA